jgi:hypothetical protein
MAAGNLDGSFIVECALEIPVDRGPRRVVDVGPLKVGQVYLVESVDASVDESGPLWTLKYKLTPRDV